MNNKISQECMRQRKLNPKKRIYSYVVSGIVISTMWNKKTFLRVWTKDIKREWEIIGQNLKTNI